MTVAVVLVFASRLLLVALFLPFSALDKLLNFAGATRQAGAVTASPALARTLVLCGLGVEVVMSLCVLTGLADRLAALVLALYCVATALLWKRFWTHPDFTLVGPSPSRDTFWDFMKNLAVAGGFLMIALGPTAADTASFLDAPFASSDPYAKRAPVPGAPPGERHTVSDTP